MRIYFLLIGIFISTTGPLFAQRACYSFEYNRDEVSRNPSLLHEFNKIERFISERTRTVTGEARLHHSVIKIPVVVHILYHTQAENISTEQVLSQIDMLNKCFRRMHSDSANTPAIFKSLAADTEIEFQLAISDPRRRSTNGIVRKYTPVAEWNMDDNMKLSAQTGDDAWDSRYYFNIWVCNLRRIAGYASAPGGDPSKDGIVIDYGMFGQNTIAGYEMGKTAVHEAGHWLGLKHIWGDNYCGDDLVGDTPKQGNYTTGCPTNTRVSCANGPAGDMYMNYMDYTNDACVNLFTQGQKSRMRTLFEPGGVRNDLLASTGLSLPLIDEAPLPEELPTWFYPNIYPNPASTELKLDVAYDIRWIGRMITIVNSSGQVVSRAQITSKVQTINIATLRPGLYFLSTTRDDGSVIKLKFIKI